MVRPTGWEATAIEKIGCYSQLQEEGHMRPPRATWGSTSVDGGRGSEGRIGPEPLSWLMERKE